MHHETLPPRRLAAARPTLPRRRVACGARVAGERRVTAGARARGGVGWSSWWRLRRLRPGIGAEAWRRSGARRVRSRVLHRSPLPWWDRRSPCGAFTSARRARSSPLLESPSAMWAGTSRLPRPSPVRDVESVWWRRPRTPSGRRSPRVSRGSTPHWQNSWARRRVAAGRRPARGPATRRPHRPAGSP
jgi:hypothetical protein